MGASDDGMGIAGITPEEARLRAEGLDGHCRRVPLVDRLADSGITPERASSTVPISTSELNKLLGDRQEGMRLLRDRGRLEAEVASVRDSWEAACERSRKAEAQVVQLKARRDRLAAVLRRWMAWDVDPHATEAEISAIQREVASALAGLDAGEG